MVWMFLCEGQKPDYHSSISFISMSKMVSALLPKKYDSSFSLKDSLMIHILLLSFIQISLYFLFYSSQQNQYILRAPWYELHLQPS